MKAKLLTLTLSSLFAASVFAGTSVAMVDLTQVFQQTPQGSAAFNTLKQELAPQVTQLQTQQQSLQNQANALEKNNQLSKDQLAAQKTKLAAQQQTLQQNIQTFQQSATQQEQALLSTFGGDVKTAVGQIAKQDGYDIVLSNQSSLYTTNDADITSQVVKAMQQQAPAQAQSSSNNS